MAPKDTSLALGMVSLMLYFSWTWVMMLISEDKKTLGMLSELREEMDKNKVCVAFEEIIPFSFELHNSKSRLIYEQIIQSSTSVIITYGETEFLLCLILNLNEFLMTRKVWIMNSPCDVTIRRRHFMLDSFHALLIFSYHYEDIFGFTNFIQTVNPSKYPEDFYLARLWILSFNCSFSETDCLTLDNCPHNVSLEWLPGHLSDMAMSEESYNIYNAVNAVTHSLQEMFLHHIKAQPTGNGKGMEFAPSQVVSVL
jgi:hypothetical protein